MRKFLMAATCALALASAGCQSVSSEAGLILGSAPTVTASLALVCDTAKQAVVIVSNAQNQTDAQKARMASLQSKIDTYCAVGATVVNVAAAIAAITSATSAAMQTTVANAAPK